MSNAAEHCRDKIWSDCRIAPFCRELIKTEFNLRQRLPADTTPPTN